jgi:hypothetical protein
MDRRAFLKTSGVVLGALTSGGLLAACGDGGGIPRVVEDAAGAGAPSNATWNVINASYELLTGEQQRFAFALTTTDNTPVEDAEVEVYTRDIAGEVLGGPYPVESYGATAVGLPLYRALIDVPEPGPIEIIAVAGGDFGASALNAVAPEDSIVPVPGQEAISVATPDRGGPRRPRRAVHPQPRLRDARRQPRRGARGGSPDHADVRDAGLLPDRRLRPRRRHDAGHPRRPRLGRRRLDPRRDLHRRGADRRRARPRLGPAERAVAVLHRPRGATSCTASTAR